MSSPTSAPTAPGSGALCSWNASSGRRRTAGGAAATSTVDEFSPPTPRHCGTDPRADRVHRAPAGRWCWESFAVRLVLWHREGDRDKKVGHEAHLVCRHRGPARPGAQLRRGRLPQEQREEGRRGWLPAGPNKRGPSCDRLIAERQAAGESSGLAKDQASRARRLVARGQGPLKRPMGLW
jgi:hypothetical protein